VSRHTHDDGALIRVLEEHAPAAGRVVTVDWVEVQAA